MEQRVKIVGIREPIVISDYVSKSGNPPVRLENSVSIEVALNDVCNLMERLIIVITDTYTCKFKYDDICVTVKATVNSGADELKPINYAAALLAAFIWYETKQPRAKATALYETILKIGIAHNVGT